MARAEENEDGFTEEEQELWETTVHTGDDMDRIFKMRDERRRREDEEELKEQWPATEAARLFTQLAETFDLPKAAGTTAGNITSSESGRRRAA
ncbi:MAG TPA: hypothetical protein VFR24_08780 [Candidatus Angelobacter sp.]|nr:hypothetical protein [Candidatus Angelobacter sp.]